MNNLSRHTLRLTDNNSLLALACLSLTIWVAHFFNFLHFGLYEDDYALISSMWRLPDFLDNTRSALVGWPQGRPIGFMLLGIFSFVGERLGGLHAIYLIGFVIITVNAFLFYILLRNISTETMALTGALMFGLFPADTTHSFLTHSLCLQVSITFFLLAAIAHLSGRRVLGYLALAAVLLTYESPFPVFLAMPLLASTWDRALVRKLLLNAGIMAVIVVAVVAVRVVFGEERVAEMRGDVPGTLKMIVQSLMIGPAVSMTQFINAPIRVIFNWNATLTVYFAAFLTFFVWVLRGPATSATGTLSDAISAGQTQIKPAHAASQTGGRHLKVWQLLVTGLAMLSLAYTLSFTHFPPIATFGRATSVHLAAALGGSLVFACICSQLLSLANRFRLRTYTVVLLSAYLALVVAYRLLIQYDFVRAWQNQHAFWTSAISAIPDMTENTVIFVLRDNLPKTSFILSNSWADPIILGQLFDFPEHWANPPRLFVVNRAWTREIKLEQNHFNWMVPDATWFAHWETLPDSNVILLDMENGKLVRRFGSLNINGLDLNLKSLPADAKLDFEKGPLYDCLIGAAR